MTPDPNSGEDWLLPRPVGPSAHLPTARRLRVLAGVVIAVAASACGGVTDPSLDGPRLVEMTRLRMGAEAHLSAWTIREADAVASFELVFAELERLDSLMSVWRDGSDVVRLNHGAGRHAVAVTSEVLDALRIAREIGDQTDGAFDVTFGALSDVWKFDHDQDNRIPAAADIAQRLPLVDYRALMLDTGAGTAALARAGMRVHLGGVGKGYAVDRAAAILRSRGLRDFMIQFGGDLYVGGRHGERPWRLGIRDPRGPEDRIFASLDLTDAALSTSADYERFFIRDGIRYHHIIDPRSGRPARGSRSVTVVASSAVQADALSTGVFVLGPEDGMALIERLPDVDGVIVTDDNRVLVSSGLRHRLDVRRPPTDAP